MISLLRCVSPDSDGSRTPSQAKMERERGLAVTVMLAPTVQKQGDMARRRTQATAASGRENAASRLSLSCCACVAAAERLF